MPGTVPPISSVFLIVVRWHVRLGITREPCSARIGVLGIAMLLSGCVVAPAFFPSATQPTPPEKVRQTPSERLLAFQDPSEGASATAVVTRDMGLFGVACHYAVVIDGSLAARLNSGETARFYLVPGEVRMKAARDPDAEGPCSVGQGEDPSELVVELRANETRRFRLHIDGRGGLHILADETRPK
jgi:hypothetical protein